MILAGDIGGTKVVLALFDVRNGRPYMCHEEVYASRDYAGFGDLLCEFLAATNRASVESVALGVAGPVVGGSCRATNLPWVLDAGEIAIATNARQVRLLNDLEAGAYGTLHLQPDQCAFLNRADPPPHRGTIAIIAAGTGLGEAILYWDGQRHHALPSEGGHTDFAPRNEDEIDLLRFLWSEQAGRVSYERVLSGAGLDAVYRFLRGRAGPEPEWLTRQLTGSDRAAVISAAGLAGTDNVCSQALSMFAEIFGAQAGDLALECMALGGVWVLGGIAPKILPVLQHGHFMRGFTAKGRFSTLLKSLEVRVALDPRTPLLGAAYSALIET